jgi:hypothetical protein
MPNLGTAPDSGCSGSTTGNVCHGGTACVACINDNSGTHPIRLWLSFRLSICSTVDEGELYEVTIPGATGNRLPRFCIQNEKDRCD